MPYRYSLLFQLTTVPEDMGSAIAHTAGWSESHWRQALISPTDPVMRELLQSRANCLPKQAAIVGYRIANYTFSGNKQLPGSVNTGKVLWPGSSVNTTDIPQMALNLSASTAGQNTSRQTMRAIPDGQVIGGEYQPEVDFKIKISRYCNSLVAGGWQMLGRDFTQPLYRVVSIIAGVMTVEPGSALIANIDQVRLFRVQDTNGRAVSGWFQLGASPAANQFTLLGFPQGVTVGMSGAVRRDIIFTYTYVNVAPGRIGTRKVGRPIEQYRGRRSRRRAA